MKINLRIAPEAVKRLVYFKPVSKYKIRAKLAESQAFNF